MGRRHRHDRRWPPVWLLVLLAAAPAGGAPAGPAGSLAAGAAEAVPDDEGARPRQPLRNVVLISIDSLRADHLPLHGYPRPTTPFLERLAKRPGSFVFERMSAVAPSCHPSHSTMLTGLYPQQVGVLVCGEDLVFKLADEQLDEEALEEVDEVQTLLRGSPEPLVRKRVSAIMNWLKIPDGAPTLATFLGERGYQTAAVVSIWTLQGRFGYTRGFDRFVDQMPQYYGPPRLRWVLRDLMRSQLRRPGGATLAHALEFLDDRDRGRPFFLFLHFADTHVPYEAPAEIDFTGETPAERQALAALRERRYPDALRRRAFDRMARRGREPLLDAYDRSIRYVDSLIERLVEQLEAQGVFEDTLLILTSDHGESFGQHLYLSRKFANRLFFEHSVYLWEETQHVPLLVHDPRRRAPVQRRSGNVSHVDVVPTVLAAVGASVEEFGAGALPGRDLLGAPDERRRVYFLTFGRGRPGLLQEFFLDFPRFTGFREGDLKFFVDRARFKHPARGRCFAYDLASDPHELDNRCADPTFAPTAATYRDELLAWYNGTVAPRRDLQPPRRRR